MHATAPDAMPCSALHAIQRRGEERRVLRAESWKLNLNSQLSNARTRGGDSDDPQTCPEPCACEQVQPECCDEPKWRHDTTLVSDYHLCLRGRGCDAP